MLLGLSEADRGEGRALQGGNSWEMRVAAEASEASLGRGDSPLFPPNLRHGTTYPPSSASGPA